MRTKKLYLKLYISVLLFAPLILIILPASFFDQGQSICLSVLLFDQPCYGCGMARAVQHLIHFDFKGAYSFNKLSFIVFPLLIVIGFGELRRAYKKIKNPGPLK